MGSLTWYSSAHDGVLSRTMNALELHRQNPSLELTPILRVIKYIGFDSNGLSAENVDVILRLYPDFEHDPELIVGIEAVSRLTKLDTERLPDAPRRSGGHRPRTIVAPCKTILGEAREPMRVAEITERVIAMGTPIKAKNPNVTISSILSSYDDFGRVRRGYYKLLRAADDRNDASPHEGGGEISGVEPADATS